MAETTFIQSQLLADHGITTLFNLRHCDCIETATLPSAPHQARQIHGTDILFCTGSGRVHQQAADILITVETGVALAVRVADCLPILLADPGAGIIAAVHAGWRGTAARIVEIAVNAMLARGADPQQILAWLGPCIGPCCFAIAADTATVLQQSVPGAATCIASEASGTHADLHAINRLQLRRVGIADAHIDINTACTACDTVRFFSYRRDHGDTGRHLAIVAIPSNT